MKLTKTALLAAVVLGATPVHADTASAHVTYGTPDGFAAGVSVCSGRDSYFFDSKWGTDGTVLQASAGTGGGRFSIGKGGVGLFALGKAVKGTVLYTWGEPVVGPPGALYIGGEVQGSFLGRVSLGVLKSLSGPQGTPSILLSASVGLGF